jgi:enolase
LHQSRERVEKYNELMWIEEAPGATVIYEGRRAFVR